MRSEFLTALSRGQAPAPVPGDCNLGASCSTMVRRTAGAAADHLFVTCRPLPGPVEQQAEALYEALLDVLASEGAGADALASETLFFRHIDEDFTIVRDARRRAVGHAREGGATTFIGQPPLSQGVDVELSAVAMIPHHPASAQAGEVHTTADCHCHACEDGVRARVVEIGRQTCLFAGSIVGCGAGPIEEASDMFRAAETLLHEAGMSFADVVRTWIYMRDIDRDYANLNHARREFFRSRGIGRKPASTGVQGIPASGAHHFSMSMYAVRSPQPLQREIMSTPTLNEAWTYGADFSRGLRLLDANNDTLYVSGTASIAEEGQTVHVGHFKAQVERMLQNVASLLAAQGASFANVASAVTYLKDPEDAPMLRRILRSRGLQDIPHALVQAPLCRPELLCEMEAVAVLPLSRSRGQ